jgi:hypothetical protein
MAVVISTQVSSGCTARRRGIRSIAATRMLSIRPSSVPVRETACSRSWFVARPVAIRISRNQHDPEGEQQSHRANA